MAFKVETIKFEGPLDLMLHLISEQKLDIFDLDMEVLTDQYIDYLHKMEKLELEVESEYLVELATLIEYKSKKLLPKPSDNLEDNYEEDPRERLVKRLLEYQKFKEVSRILEDSYLSRLDQLSKPVSLDIVNKNTVNDDVKLEGNPYDLLKAMNKVLRRLQLAKPIETKYTAKEISVEDRMLEIKANLIKLPETFSFEDLSKDCSSVHEVVVTFMAILVMAKDHDLVFEIDEQDNILFKRGVGHE